MGHILIVDDEPDVRELFKITLSMAGYRIETASHGLEAIEAIAKDVPELIVLDLMMPRLDGFGVLEKLRANKPTENLMVLIATAKTIEDADKGRLESWPVVGVLNKGELDIAQMVIAVKELLDQKPPTSTSQPSKADSSKTPSAASQPPKAETPKSPSPASPPPKTGPPKSPSPASPPPRTPSRATPPTTTSGQPPEKAD